MNYEERLENVAVLGAAGKMGSGIVLLVAAEMADLALRPENRSRKYVLHAVDVSQRALSGLMRYLREQARKSAEKRIVALRKTYADRSELVSNGEIIEAYINDVLDVVRPTTTLEAAAEASVIFEAAPESLDLKLKLLTVAGADNPRQPWVFTNTSSIPIQEVGPGELLGWSWLLPPYKWGFDARAAEATIVVVFDGASLRSKCEQNFEFGFRFLQLINIAISQRLDATRSQLLEFHSQRPRPWDGDDRLAARRAGTRATRATA